MGLFGRVMKKAVRAAGGEVKRTVRRTVRKHSRRVARNIGDRLHGEYKPKRKRTVARTATAGRRPRKRLPKMRVR